MTEFPRRPLLVRSSPPKLRPGPSPTQLGRDILQRLGQIRDELGEAVADEALRRSKVAIARVVLEHAEAAVRLKSDVPTAAAADQSSTHRTSVLSWRSAMHVAGEITGDNDQ